MSGNLNGFSSASPLLSGAQQSTLYSNPAAHMHSGVTTPPAPAAANDSQMLSQLMVELSRLKGELAEP